MAKKGKNLEGNGNQSSPMQSMSSRDTNGISAEEIAARAYTIYDREGRVDGRDMDHWLRAEQELRSERQGAENGSRPSERQVLPSTTTSVPVSAGPTAASTANTEPRSARRAKGI